MPKITPEEVLKIARMSHLEIHEDEINGFVQQMESVLSYAARVQEAAASIELVPHNNSNIYREDNAILGDAQKILEQAPEREQDYFVVPAILDTHQ